jgi:hypothetical protein
MESATCTSDTATVSLGYLRVTWRVIGRKGAEFGRGKMLSKIETAAVKTQTPTSLNAPRSITSREVFVCDCKRKILFSRGFGFPIWDQPCPPDSRHFCGNFPALKTGNFRSPLRGGVPASERFQLIEGWNDESECAQGDEVMRFDVKRAPPCIIANSASTCY